ncbi:MAG: hypothetical protein OEZ22_09270 [Spirochaetia bacterium]|nr:hypothetical protein [Spirochaetia bacterium]
MHAPKINQILLKSIISLGASGFIISLLASIIGSADYKAIIWQPLVSALVMAILGSAGYFIFEKFIPQFIKKLSAEEDIESMSDSLDIDNTENSENFNIENESISDDIENIEKLENDDIPIKERAINYASAKKKKQAGEGEILVEGVPIKNEPKLMAEAIQHLLHQDE